jgi:asparagine synthase (glutamine-hydrolysing)
LMTTPGSIQLSKEGQAQLHAAMLVSGSRVLLAGTGGDEITGGVPTPIPELQDLFARLQFGEFAHRLKLWALNKRRPWLNLFWESTVGFLPSGLVRLPKYLRAAPWIESKFVKRYPGAFKGYDSRTTLTGSLPSLQQNIAALNLLRRQVGSDGFSSCVHEKRFPYLDREFVEFMYAVPREQVVRPGHRRSLMRRALVGIVPSEILGRKRKAYITRSAMAAVAAEWSKLEQVCHEMAAASLGLIDQKGFSKALDAARHGREIPIAALARTLYLEFWLRNLKSHSISVNVRETSAQLFPPLRTISAEEN